MSGRMCRAARSASVAGTSEQACRRVRQASVAFCSISLSKFWRVSSRIVASWRTAGPREDAKSRSRFQRMVRNLDFLRARLNRQRKLIEIARAVGILNLDEQQRRRKLSDAAINRRRGAFAAAVSRLEARPSRECARIGWCASWRRTSAGAGSHCGQRRFEQGGSVTRTNLPSHWSSRSKRRGRAPATMVQPARRAGSGRISSGFGWRVAARARETNRARGSANRASSSIGGNGT